MKERIRTIFKNLGTPADALILANAIDPHLDRSFFYAFDVPSGLFEGSLAIGLPDGHLHVFSSPLEEESALQAAKLDRDVDVHVPTSRAERDAFLLKIVPKGAKVALNYRELTYEMFLGLQKPLGGASFLDASEAIRKTRMIKDAGEIERLSKAAEIASAVGREIPEMLRTGMTELALAAEMEYRMMRHGSSGASFSTIVAFDVKGAEPHYAPQDRKLAPGSSIVCDFGAYFRRYASDITRSFRVGPRDAEMKKVHETVLMAQEAALRKIRPGVPAKEVHLAAAAVIDASPWKGRFTHGLGHSVGLAVHDGFSMNHLVDEPLAEGMAITVEPGIYLPGKGGVRIEDDVVVTKDGYRFLTTAPREYLEVPVRFGVLTGGGDCPGLNAAIRGVVYRATREGHEVLGFLDGWKGLRDDLTMPLSRADVREGISKGGTILGSSRTNPFKQADDAAKVHATLKARGIDALVAIGGDDTLKAGRELFRAGGKVVGVPKTMDNDVNGTDWTFGFDSASTVAVDALMRLRDTAGSHHRAVILEVMGRHAGWVALATGIAGGADATLLPEEKYDEEALLRKVRAAVKERGHAVIVVSEGIELGAAKGATGARDEFGHELLRERGVGAALAKRIESSTGVETRTAQIGHIQRGGPPTLFDRLLATRLGVKAVELALAGDFGKVAVLRGERVEGVPFDDCLRSPKTVTADWLDLLRTFDA